MKETDLLSVVQQAWHAYDASRVPVSIQDISAKVSTNHVYKLVFDDHSFLVAKLSWFGTYEHFKEDHNIIHVLSNKLTGQFEHFLADSLLAGDEVFTYRHIEGEGE